MLEDYALIRKLNEIEYLMKLILNRLPEDETLEDLIERKLKEKDLAQSQNNT